MTIRAAHLLLACVLVFLAAAPSKADSPPRNVDASFVPPPIDGAVELAAVQSDGKILIAGSFQKVGGQRRISLARLEADGKLDESFNPPVLAFTHPRHAIRSVRILSNHQVAIAGSFASMVQGEPRETLLAILNPDGSVNKTFFVCCTEAYDLTEAGNGYLVAGNLMGALNPDIMSASFHHHGVALLTENGLVDSALRYGLHLIQTPDNFQDPPIRHPGIGYALARDANGNFILGGAFNALSPGDDRTQQNLVRFLPDYRVDRSFNPAIGAGFDGGVKKIVIQPDGKLLVSGAFYTHSPEAGYQEDFVRLNPDGSVDPEFRPLNEGFVSFDAEADGKILALSRSYLKRLDSQGKNDNRFPIISLAPGEEFKSVIAAGGGKAYVIGNFTNLAGLEISKIARIDTTIQEGPKPAISSVEADRFPVVGKNALFTAVATGENLSWQWFFNGQPLAHGTNYFLSLTNISLADNGSYTVTVSNALGAASSEPFVVEPLGLTKALDDPQLRWTNVVSFATWFPKPGEGILGGSAAGREGTGRNVAALETSVEGPGLFSFWYKNDLFVEQIQQPWAGGGWITVTNDLRVFVDGSLKRYLAAGPESWTKVNISIPDGNHAVKIYGYHHSDRLDNARFERDIVSFGASVQRFPDGSLLFPAQWSTNLISAPAVEESLDLITWSPAAGIALEEGGGLKTPKAEGDSASQKFYRLRVSD